MKFSVNQRIKDLRLSLNLTQKEFADSLNVTQATISAIEKCKAGYSMQLLEKVCEVYNIDISYFFSSKDEQVGLLEKIKTDLTKFQGVLIGKFGEKVWKELEPYYPKYKQAV